MAADPRKRQKKLQRRASKRQDKKRELAKAQNAGLAEKLAKTTKYPILHASINEEFWSQGIGSLLISRQLPNGSVAFGCFLLDRYCLGVKDAFGDIRTKDEYEEKFLRGNRAKYKQIDLSPATARKFVEGCVAYAADLGFAPQGDYAKVKAIFGDINPADSDETLEYGQDGKPHFIAGPRDGPARCRQIIAILTHRCGEDGFHYTIPIGGDEFLFDGDEELNDEEYDDGDDEDVDNGAGEGPIIYLDENEVHRLPKQ